MFQVVLISSERNYAKMRRKDPRMAKIHINLYKLSYYRYDKDWIGCQQHIMKGNKVSSQLQYWVMSIWVPIRDVTFRRCRFGDGHSATPFRRQSVRRKDVSATWRFGDKNIGRFGDERFWDLCVCRTFRWQDVSATKHFESQKVHQFL